jgi:hypothetical protein
MDAVYERINILLTYKISRKILAHKRTQERGSHTQIDALPRKNERDIRGAG